MEIAQMLRLIERKGVDAIEGVEVEVKGFTGIDNEFKRILRRAAVCLANTSGGQIILGVDETTNSVVGCPDVDPLELTNIVFEGTRPGILVGFERHVTPDGRSILHCRVPRSPRVHATSDGARFHRVGKKCLPLYPEDERRMLVQKGALDVTSQPLPELTVADLEKAALEAASRLWGKRRGDGGPDESAIADEPGQLLETLGVLVNDAEGRGRPTVASAILFASKRTIAPYLPGRKLIYVLMKDATEYRLKRTWEDATLLAIDEVMAIVFDNSRVETLRVGPVQHDIPDFPPDAVREVLLNAVAHRDYMIGASIMVVQHGDRLEITSPGGFVGGVTPDNILHHNPTHRNPTLVGLMHGLGLIEEIGVGVDRVYETLLRHGKEPPVYEATADYVRCVLESGRLDGAFVKFVESQADRGEGVSLDELQILHEAKRFLTIDRATAARLTQRSEREATTILMAMVDRRLLSRHGSRGGSHYRLSSGVARQLGVRARSLKHPYIDDLRARALVLQVATEMGEVTNSDVRELLDVDRHKAMRLLAQMVRDGELRRKGSKRWARYVPRARSRK